MQEMPDLHGYFFGGDLRMATAGVPPAQTDINRMHQQFGNLDSGFSWFPLVSGLPETWKLGDSAHIELKCENY